MLNTVILTGSGISAESGVATFRDTGGVWAKYDYREVATPEGFARNPALVHEFYNLRRAGLVGVNPNAAHIALAQLEQQLEDMGGGLTLITQNVDDLHQRAGSRNILPMHGELLKARCEHCGAVNNWTGDLSTEVRCPDCKAKGGMRPHIVWFGEIPMHLDQIETALMEADLFVSIGTSGSVYPAAGIVHAARAQGMPCTELNLEPSENATIFTETCYGLASEIVPQWAQRILQQQQVR